MLTTAAIVLLVLLFFTKPLQYMPTAVLASVVFVIGIELVDLGGMRAVMRLRIDEFLIAVLTAAVVVFVGVEQAIVLAIIISIINHLRFSYKPNDSVLVRNPEGRWHSIPVAPNMQAAPGVVVYRFAADLYYANANRLNEEALSVVEESSTPVHHLILDAASIFDVDYSGAETILQVLGELDKRDVRLLIAQATSALREQLDRLGITDVIGTDAYFATVSEAIEHATQGPQAHSSGKDEAHGE
jgi:MFS superfamily sulfate permease-like transporter